MQTLPNLLSNDARAIDEEATSLKQEAATADESNVKRQYFGSAFA